MTGQTPDIAGAVNQKPGQPRRYRLDIAGTVQGVGFRPFVYRLAVTHNLGGHTMNSRHGLIVEVEGPLKPIRSFISELRHSPPLNANISDMTVTEIPRCHEYEFTIQESTSEEATTTSVLPDLATCNDCLTEIFDPANRRYLYPFTNCTACGPRYSIITGLPYDRERTTMQAFMMCEACQAEYRNPLDRRFHAEPNACPECGPQLALLDTAGIERAIGHAALQQAAVAIRAGQIVAIKGLGGFQLFADARHAEVIEKLRQRKQRPGKPFAIMLPTIESAQQVCQVSESEAILLAGRERPIVLLRRRQGAISVTASVAPGNPWLGVMLPYTPLHHLLMAELDMPVVATSGNLSDEPIAIDNDEARDRLAAIADCFLTHDRSIVRPVDDSIVRVIRERSQILRRARGYAPAPIRIGSMPGGVMATGGHLKATVACTQQDKIILSQHIGDLDSPLGRDTYEAIINDLLRLHAIQPRVIACDLHPDYYTTQSAEITSKTMKAPLIRVQHHLAHVAAGMAEHELRPPLIGIAWDGTGYGPDGTIWGGEFMAITNEGWSRIAHLKTFRLPGGTASIREPRRAALGLLYALYGNDVLEMDHLPVVSEFNQTDRRTLVAILAKGTNSPVTTSAGRLFDAVSALLGLCQSASYEGEAACRLEWAVGDKANERQYEMPVQASMTDTGSWVVDWSPAVYDMLSDYTAGIPVSDIASGFHASLVTAMTQTVKNTGIDTVMLTGGCFQNAVLLDRAIGTLQQAGCSVYWHEKIPPGDGGLALGQAFWAARIVDKDMLPCV